jgi:hypothetical protein
VSGVRSAGPASRAAAGWVALAVAVAAIGLVLAVSRSGRTATLTPVTTAAPAPTETGAVASPTPRPTPPPDDDRQPPITLDTILTLLAGCVLFLFGYLTVLRIRGGSMGLFERHPRVRHRYRQTVLPATGEPVADALTEAVDAALRRIEEGEPQDAVIACWVLLERAAADAGTERRPSETPAELVARVLAEHRVSEPVLHRLAGLYREARYSHHRLDEAERTAAREALHQVRAELTGELSAR